MNSWGSNTRCTEIFTPGQSNARGRVNQPRIVPGASTAVGIPVPSTRHTSPKWSSRRVTSGIKNPSDPGTGPSGAGVTPGPGLGPGPLMKYSTNDPPGNPSPRALAPNAEAGGAVPVAVVFGDESKVASAAEAAVFVGVVPSKAPRARAVPPHAEIGGAVPVAGVLGGGSGGVVQVQRRAV